MASRIAPLLHPPIAFAHRGARAIARDNTIEAFVLALAMGATGLESDVWVTADGTAVLDHDGVVGRLVNRRSIGDVSDDKIPGHIPTLESLFASCGSDFDLSLDIKTPAAAAAVVRAVRAASDRAGANLASRVWLCHPDWQLCAQWKGAHPDFRVVDSTRLGRIKEGPERRAALLAEAGVDAINMHHSDWSGGLTTLFHRFGLYCFGWDAQYERVLDETFDLGIDGLYSDHVDRMMRSHATFHGDGQGGASIDTTAQFDGPGPGPA